MKDASRGLPFRHFMRSRQCAVVVTDELKPEYARQGRHVDFTLVFVASDDVDGVSCSSTGQAVGWLHGRGVVDLARCAAEAT